MATFHVSEYGGGSRATGEKMRNDITSFLDSGGDLAVLDFGEVLASHGFIDESLGKLPPYILSERRIKVINADESTRALIYLVLSRRTVKESR